MEFIELLVFLLKSSFLILLIGIVLKILIDLFIIEPINNIKKKKK